MFGCYRKGDANDPETYTAAVTAILAEYSPEVIKRITDPRSGLPRKLKWLPTVAEVSEACDEAVKTDDAHIFLKSRGYTFDGTNWVKSE